MPQVTLSQESQLHLDTHSHFSTSLAARSLPNTTAANNGGRHSSLSSPAPMFLPAPSVFARLCFLRSSLPPPSVVPAALSSPCLACLCLRLVPRLPLLPRRHRVGNSSKLSSCRSSALSRRWLALQRCNTATTRSWKIVPDSVSGFLLLLLRRLLVESLKKGLGFCADGIR
ncbi:hypothetical protein Ahy_B06g083887 isoform C [Arachis hypogaea]|uniref:Uncharacterized protein n=1 Tax=Arachis hypogaea TaxID=3818 RepID=A0A444YQV9_ARAHY|nr:hypothetical protein Ahy_B06g083887 isoform C [Arachis hypogaea]